MAVVRVPAADYRTALGEIESLGNITDYLSTSNDVTVKYVGLNATLQSLLAEKASLLHFLNQSTSVSETLQIESQIQSVDSQINGIKSEILQTNTLVNYSTITVTFSKQGQVIPLSVKVTVAPRTGTSPLSVTFNAIVTGGSQQYIVNYNFDNGTSAQGQALIHTFASPGTYNVTIIVSDSSGSVAETWVLVQASGATTRFDFSGFYSTVTALFVNVVEGIAEVAVVIIPLVLVVGAVSFPIRKFFFSKKESAKQSQ